MRLSGFLSRLGGGLVGRPGFLAVLVNPGRPGFGRLVVGLQEGRPGLEDLVPLGLLCACLSGLNKEGGEEADGDGDGDDDNAHDSSFESCSRQKGNLPPLYFD